MIIYLPKWYAVFSRVLHAYRICTRFAITSLGNEKLGLKVSSDPLPFVCQWKVERGTNANLNTSSVRVVQKTVFFSDRWFRRSLASALPFMEYLSEIDAREEGSRISHVVRAAHCTCSSPVRPSVRLDRSSDSFFQANTRGEKAYMCQVRWFRVAILIKASEMEEKRLQWSSSN